MSPHIIEWLAAYHDGELPSNRQHQVEKHLLDCPACRAELDMLEELSSLLKADPAPDQTPPERFAAQVQLRLPRSLPPRHHQNEAQVPRWALGIPLALVIVWAFLQAALRVTSLILTTSGILDHRIAFLSSWVRTESLYETGINLVLLNTIFFIGITILWSAWMAFWLAWKRNQNLNLSSTQLSKEV